MTTSFTRRRAIVLLPLAALLPACSLTRPAPVKRTFLLEPALPVPGPRTQAGTAARRCGPGPSSRTSPTATTR